MNNRHFISLPRERQAQLKAQFPELRELAEEGSANGVQHIAVSVFDHWLSVDEAIAEIDEVSLDSQRVNDAKLHAFTCGLASRSQCYLVKFKGRHHQHATFRAFTSDSARNRWLTPLPYNIGDKWRFQLVFPQLEMVYFEGSDFTHHIYLKHSIGQRVVEEAAIGSGVYVL